MAAEAVLEKAISIRVMPTPREITASCGIAIQMALPELAGALEALEESGADPSGFQGYAITHEDGRIKARPWGEK